jgi:hypothetical protein
MVEFLLVAFILAVGLLGLGALQVATVRGGAGARNRMVAATLATGALESVLAEARRVWEAAAVPGPGMAPPPAVPLVRRFTSAETSRWLERFDRDGLPAARRDAFYTVTVTRAEPVLPAGAGGLLAARVFQATVTWEEDAAPAPPGRLALSRIIAY